MATEPFVGYISSSEEIERIDIEFLYTIYYRKLVKVSVDYTQYLYEKIN